MSSDELNEQQQFEAFVIGQLKNLGGILEQHEYILRAVTGDLKALGERVSTDNPDPGKVVDGETRGDTTAYRMPHGYGMLLVNIDPATDMATIEVKNQGYRERVQIQFKKGRG